MKILVVTDEEYPAFYESYQPGRLDGYDLIISCGDLKASYLTFLSDMSHCPVLYVHGNHDTAYRKCPPGGCDCIDDKVVVYNGVRILGLGGCRWYHPGEYQVTERAMRRRIRKLRFPLWRARGIDLVVTHAPPEGVGDAEDPAHRGFAALRALLEKYHPAYLLHGHVHLSYGADKTREREYAGTRVINCYQHYELEIADKPHDLRRHGSLIWKNGEPEYEPEYGRRDSNGF